MNRGFQDRLKNRLEADGHRVVAGEEIVWTNEGAVREAKRLRALGCDCTIFNFAVWAFPHLPALASRFAPGPLLLFSQVNPQYPGLVGMLASAGGLNQAGTPFARAFGEIEDEATYARVRSFVRAAGAVSPCAARHSAWSAGARWGCTPRQPIRRNGSRSSAWTWSTSIRGRSCGWPPKCPRPRSSRPSAGWRST